jgi:hypothetical protein
MPHHHIFHADKDATASGRNPLAEIQQHCTGHAVWRVLTGTACLLLIGFGIEISVMFDMYTGLTTPDRDDDLHRELSTR